ncbi:MAG: peptidylprolyl isomerase [Flavobacteriales bacterium]
MAIIGKIRKHSTLLIAMVGVSLVLFILSDFWGNSSGGPGGPTEALGEIYGDEIDFVDFQAEVDRIVQENFTSRGGSPDDKQMENIREYVWSHLINKTIYDNQFGSFGMMVTPREMEDLIFGNNIQPDIMQNEMFKDSMTGQFDLRQLKKFRQMVDQSPEYRQYWVTNIEKPLMENRVVTKYFNMVSKGLYVTTAEANADYINNTRKLRIRFVQAPYAAIPDSTITVTEEEIKNYYEKNKHRKKHHNNEGMRQFSYVRFQFAPSEYDINAAKGQAERLKEGFIRSTNDSDYVMRYAETKVFSDEISTATYPADIDSLIQNSDSGTVIGPYPEGDKFKVIKIRKSKFEDRYDSRHILIAYKGAMRAEPNVVRSKDQAKKLADSLLNVIKRKSNFEELVPVFSADRGSIENGGKYENILKGGGFALPYETFCMTAKKNDIKVVETDFGYHILQALGAYKKKAVSCATVDVKIVALNATKSAAQAKAFEFYKSVEGKTKNFLEIAQKKKLIVTPLEINVTQKEIEGPGGRTLASWVQRSNEGDLSEPTLFNDSYVIATVTRIKEKGVPELDDIREIVKAKVLAQKKGEILAKKLQGAKSLEEAATRVKSTVQDAELTFNSGIIPGTNGTENRVVGSIFSMQKRGDLSVPLVGENGVFVVLLENITEAPPAPDIANNKKNLTSGLRSRAQSEAYQALREKAKIVDNRHKFF